MISFLRIVVAFTRRDILQMTSYKFSMLLNLSSTFFMLLILFFLSNLFSGLGSGYLDSYGGEYFPFVVLGLAMMSMVTAGLTGFTSTIRTEQAIGTLEPMLTAPAGAFKTFAAASVARNATTFIFPAIYIGMSAIFYHKFILSGIPELIFVAMLTSATYFGIGMISASFTIVFKRGNPISMIFGRLPNLLAGVWFPVALLPAWLQKASYILPVTYGLEAARMAIIPGTEGESRLFIYSYLTIYAVAALGIGYVTFRFALRKAKKDGSLSHY